MKKSDKSASLFTILTRSFLCFTLTLLAMAVGLYYIWNRCADTWFGLGDVDGMIESAAFYNGNYDRIDTVRYLGNGGGFAVFGADGALIYRAPQNMLSDLTADELRRLMV